MLVGEFGAPISYLYMANHDREIHNPRLERSYLHVDPKGVCPVSNLHNKLVVICSVSIDTNMVVIPE